MAFADVVDGQIIVQSTWDEKDLAKQVPGARWSSAHKAWTFPLAWATCVTLRGVFGSRLTVGVALNEWAWSERQSRVGPSLGLRELATPPHGQLEAYDAAFAEFGGPDRNLFDFQRVGAYFLTVAGDALLGDEMGTGKTIQTLAALWLRHHAHRDALPAIVICPNSVKTHWGERAAEWLPEAVPYVLTGSLLQRRKVLERAREDPRALVIVNIEGVRTLSRLAPYGSIRLARCTECDPRGGSPTVKTSSCEVHHKELNDFEFKTCILDEAHRVKDPSTKQTRAIWAVFHAAAVVRRWALTGTPIANHPGDLWSPMHAVAPDDFPVKTKFIDRYAYLSWNAFGGMDIVGLKPNTRDEFFQIFDPRFRRMTKALVLPQLPLKVRTVRNAEMTPKQKRAYVDIEKRLVTTLDDGTILVASSNLTAQTRLLQLASSYCEITYGEDPEDVTGWQVRLKEPSPKVDELIDVIRELAGQPVAIAAEHRQLIELAQARLEAEKIPHVLITGQVPETQRAVNLAAFSGGQVNVILFTYKAGGVGLDMSRAGTLVRLQRSWSLVDNKQGEDRVHRIGSEQHACVNIIDVVTAGTVEEAQTRRLIEKMTRLEEITRDREKHVRAGLPVDQFDMEINMLMSAHLGEA